MSGEPPEADATATALRATAPGRAASARSPISSPESGQWNLAARERTLASARTSDPQGTVADSQSSRLKRMSRIAGGMLAGFLSDNDTTACVLGGYGSRSINHGDRGFSHKARASPRRQASGMRGRRHAFYFQITSDRPGSSKSLMLFALPSAVVQRAWLTRAI
jgi:hypothetical protein